MINLEKFEFLNLLSQKPSFLRRLLMGDTLHLRCLETKDFCLYTKSFVRFCLCRVGNAWLNSLVYTKGGNDGKSKKNGSTD